MSIQKNDDLVKNLHYDIGEVAKKLEVHPSELTISQFHTNTDGKYSAYDLEKIGGFRSFIKTHFSHPEKDLKTIYENKKQREYITELENRVAKIEYDLGKELQKIEIKPLVLNPNETKAYFSALRAGKPKNEKSSVVTLWSDFHFGEVVTLKDTHGKNEYNSLIAARRFGMLCEEVATFQSRRRYSHEELVILMMGDMIHGIIHDWETHSDLKDQIVMFYSYAVDALYYLRNFYPKIRVVCQPGNHERMMHKSSKDRVMQNKSDSYANVVYESLRKTFEKDPKITFEIDKSPFADIMIQGHRVYATHGDTVLSMGNPGTSINTKMIRDQINNINVSEANKGRVPYKLFLSGHLHEYMEKQMGKLEVIVNGCLVGLDQYALSRGIQDSNPIQLLWETTKEHVRGELRLIRVGKADNMPRFEKIIKPYQS